MKDQPRNPKPGFYKVLGLVFLAVGALLIWRAVVQHDGLYWAFGIMTIINAAMCGLKSLVPQETRR